MLNSLLLLRLLRTNSKTFLSIYVYRNLSHRVLPSRKAVSCGGSCRRLCLFFLRADAAGVKYELVGHICVQGKSYALSHFSSVPVSDIGIQWVFPSVQVNSTLVDHTHRHRQARASLFLAHLPTARIAESHSRCGQPYRGSHTKLLWTR